MAKGVKGSSPTENDKKERTSFNLVLRLTKKLRIIAANDGSDMSAIINGLIEKHVAEYEKKNGEIQVK